MRVIVDSCAFSDCESNGSNSSDSNFSAVESSPSHHQRLKLEKDNNKEEGKLLSSIHEGEKEVQDNNSNNKNNNDSESGNSSSNLKDFSNNSNKYIIPPPEDLIAKSVYIVEPIRTGAPINFV